MLMHRSAWTLLLAIGATSAATLSTTRTEAAPDQVIQYQGRLVDTNGVPLEGTIGRLSFRVFSSATPSPATFVWGEAHSLVSVNRGVFTVHLGAGSETLDVNGVATAGSNPFTTEFDGAPRFIEVQVNNDAPLTPLSRIGSVPQAVSSHTTRAVFDPATSTALDLPALDTRYVEPSEVDGIVTQATTTVAGKVTLATDGETTAGEAVQASDSRLTGIQVRKNSGVTVTGRRPRINFVEGPNVTITAVEDASEVDVTISASSASVVVGTQQSTSGASKTVPIPAGTLAVDGDGFFVWASGSIGGGSGLRLTWDGVQIIPSQNVGGFEPAGTWVIEGYLIRTGPNSLVASFHLTIEGQDANLGSQIESFVQPHLTISTNLTSGSHSLAVGYEFPASNSEVNVLRVRKEH